MHLIVLLAVTSDTGEVTNIEGRFVQTYETENYVSKCILLYSSVYN